MVKRRGFETSWVTPGTVQYAYAEAFDRSGSSIGFSPMASLTPIFDPNYVVAYPALQGVKDTAVPLSPTPAPIPEDGVAAESDLDAQRLDLDGQPQQGEGKIHPSVPEQAPHFVVYIFAAFGLYCALRSLYRMISGRRKGYQAIPVYADGDSQ